MASCLHCYISLLVYFVVVVLVFKMFIKIKSLVLKANSERQNGFCVTLSLLAEASIIQNLYLSGFRQEESTPLLISVFNEYHCYVARSLKRKQLQYLNCSH